MLNECTSVHFNARAKYLRACFCEIGLEFGRFKVEKHICLCVRLCGEFNWTF